MTFFLTCLKSYRLNKDRSCGYTRFLSFFFFNAAGEGHGDEDHPQAGPAEKARGAPSFLKPEPSNGFSNVRLRRPLAQHETQRRLSPILRPLAGTLNFRRKKVGRSLPSSGLCRTPWRAPCGPRAGSQGTLASIQRDPLPCRPCPGTGVRSASQRVASRPVVTPTSPSILPSAPMQRYRTLCTPLMATFRRATARISTKPGAREAKSCSRDPGGPRHVGAVGAGARAPLALPQLPALSGDSGWGERNAEASRPRVPRSEGPARAGKGGGRG